MAKTKKPFKPTTAIQVKEAAALKSKADLAQIIAGLTQLGLDEQEINYILEQRVMQRAPKQALRMAFQSYFNHADEKAGVEKLEGDERIKQGKELVTNELAKAYAIRGITENKLADIMSCGLDARRVVQDKDGLHETDVPDHRIRLDYLKLVHANRGDIVSKTENHGVSFTFTQSNEATEASFKEYLEKKSKGKAFVGSPVIEGKDLEE